MLTSAWPETIGESHEVCLINGVEQRYDRLLNYFVLQAPDTQWPLRSVWLGNTNSFSRSGKKAPYQEHFQKHTFEREYSQICIIPSRHIEKH